MATAARIIFAIGVITGMAWLCSPWYHPGSAFSEEEHIAVHLARGEGFSSPFADGPSAPPSAWCPPVYPVLVATVYRAMGIRTPAAILTVILFNILCRAAAAAAIVALGRRLWCTTAGVAAAILFLLSPSTLYVTHYCWDNCLALAIFLWLLATAEALPPILLGAGTGLLLLTNAAYLLAVPVILFPRRRHWAMAATGLFLILAPWTLRNFEQFHRLFFIRGNLYTELWLGNQPGSNGWMTLGTLANHPSNDPVNRAQVLTLGEMRYADLCRERFWAEYDAAPADFWTRSAHRAIDLFVDGPRHSGATLEVVLAALGLAGVWAAWRLRLQIMPLLSAAIGVAAPYVPTQVHDRYALPLRAILCIMAGISVSLAWKRLLLWFPSSSKPAEPRAELQESV
jgi:hypothetical protein